MKEGVDFIEEIVWGSVAEDHGSFFKSFDFSYCVGQFDRVSFVSKNNVIICNEPQLLYLLSPFAIIINYNIMISLLNNK
jgi:hypothetical protein